jgi:MFS family permease
MPRTGASNDRWFYSYLLANMAQGGSSLLIPLFAAGALGATVSQVGLITSIANMASVPTSIFWGRLSDRLRQRKRFALIGFIGLFLTLAAMGLSRSLTQLGLFNALLAASWMSSAAVATLLAIQGVESSRWESRIGRFNRNSGTGWVSGLLLGALWTGVISPVFDSPADGMRALFFMLAILALVGVWLGARWIVERPIEDSRLTERRFEGIILAVGQLWERFKYAPARLYHIPNLKRLRDQLRGENGFGKELTRFFQVINVYSIGFQIFFVPFPLFLRDVLQLSNSEIFALYIVHSGTSAYFNMRAGRLAERLGSRVLQSTFLIVRAAAFLASGLILSAARGDHLLLLPLIAFFFTMTGMSWAFINVSAISTISKLAREGMRGQALGLYNAIAGLGAIIGSLVGGFVAEFSYVAAFALAAAMVLAGWLMLQFRTRGGKPQEQQVVLAQATNQD